jgi:signal transduction histidine kinase
MNENARPGQTNPLTTAAREAVVSRLKARFRRLPLFARIFAVVLGGILCAQVVNFTVILLVHLPQSQVYLLSDIAHALQSGEDPLSELTISIGNPPSEADQDQRDLDIRARLADRLGIDVQQLRLQVDRPPTFFKKSKQSEETKFMREEDVSKAGVEGAQRSELIAGSFVSAMRMADGRWRLVSVKGGFIEPWQWQSLLWLLGTLLVAVPLAWIMSRRVAEPVRLFSFAAERLGRDPSVPPLLAPGGPPEIAAAISAFNGMQARLKRYVDDRTTMVAAIAHDLRTPLMRLTLILENAPAETRLPAEAEIREMTERIRGTLAFVRDVSLPVRRQKLELRTLVESAADEMVDRGADVTVEPGEDITIEADVAGMRALVANLLGNAVQYAGHAQVTLRRVDGQVLIEVADSGGGIPEAELEKVFTPFYRVESSRNRETGGTGLGLASARAVARAHGGDIILRNRPEGGLLAVVSLPFSA